MSERRDFGRMAQQMCEALDQYSREDLIDLLTHIVRVYVIESESGPLDMTASAGGGMEELRGLSFGQLVMRLQMTLPQPELQRLRVSGGRVWASVQDQELCLTGAEAPESPPDAEIIDREPPTRVSAEEAFGARGATQPAVAERAATGPTSPGVVAQSGPPRPGTPRPRASSREGGAAATAQQAGRVERPGVGLREEAAGRAPQPPRREWDMEAPDRPRRGGAAEPGAEPEDEVGETSDRFSMLELD